MRSKDVTLKQQRPEWPTGNAHLACEESTKYKNNHSIWASCIFGAVVEILYVNLGAWGCDKSGALSAHYRLTFEAAPGLPIGLLVLLFTVSIG